MSVKVMGLVWDLELPPNEKLVLLAYADHANHDGGNIFPAVLSVAKKTGYSERSIQSITRELEEKGLLVEDGKGPRRTNKWRVGGAIISPVNSAPVQPDAVGGASPTGTGMHPAAPEPSEPIMESSDREDRAPDFSKMTIPEAHKLPTLKMYADATEFFPGSPTWEFVHETITKNQLTFDQIRNANIAWNLAGYKRENVKGILEWACNGIPERHQIKIVRQASELPRPTMRELDDFTPIPSIAVKIGD